MRFPLNPRRQPWSSTFPGVHRTQTLGAAAIKGFAPRIPDDRPPRARTRVSVMSSWHVRAPARATAAAQRQLGIAPAVADRNMRPPYDVRQLESRAPGGFPHVAHSAVEMLII